MGGFLNRWWRRRSDNGRKWQPARQAPGEQRLFARWAAAGVYRNWTGPWYKAYHYCRAGLPTAWPVQVLPPNAVGPPQGVALLYDERIGRVNFHHLFVLLRERVLALGYRVAHADRRNCPQRIHPADTVEKYVLHPLPKDTPGVDCGPGCCDQRFGQVTIDLLQRNQQPIMLRLLAHPLPDAIFTQAPPFDELLRLVLGCDA